MLDEHPEFVLPQERLPATLRTHDDKSARDYLVRDSAVARDTLEQPAFRLSSHRK